MKKKRIFMVGYSGNKGGVEQYIDQLIPFLSDYEVILCLPRMVIDGKTWIRPQNRHHYIPYRLFWSRFFRENCFDVLYYNTCDIVSLDMIRFAKKVGVPVRIIHSHSTGNERNVEHRTSLFHSLSERINRRTLPGLATHFLACSRQAGEWMFSRHPFTVIHNGIDLNRYQFDPDARKEIRQQYGYSDHDTMVIVVGRISPPKNPLFSVRIIREMHHRDESVRAVFIGDGELRKRVEDAVKDEGIQSDVLFTGITDQIPEWMSAADVLLLPSLFEGLPYVLMEAQASGLPCIVSTAVSKEADATGLITWLDLTESEGRWAEEALVAAKKPRKETREDMIRAGYDIRESAAPVVEMIADALEI